MCVLAFLMVVFIIWIGIAKSLNGFVTQKYSISTLQYCRLFAVFFDGVIEKQLNE